MGWRGFGKFGHGWDFDAWIRPGSKRDCDSDRGGHNGSGKGSHGGSDKGSHGGWKGSHGGSDKGSHGGSDNGSHDWWKGSHGGSDKGSHGGWKGSHGGSGKGSHDWWKGSHGGSDKGSHDWWKGSHGGSDKGSHGGSRGSASGPDGCDYLCGGNGDRIEVAENTTAVTNFDPTLPRTSDDSDVIYLIHGGDDAGLFSIDEEGALVFDDAPDFEAPGDADGDNVYDVTVRTISKQNPCNYEDAKLCVEVTDVEPETPPPGPNAAPTITGEPLVETITNRMGGDVVATLFAQDPNVTDTLTFTLDGDDKDAFTLVNNDADPSDGVDLELVVKSEFVDEKTDAGEEEAIFDVTVIAADQLGADADVSFTFELQILAG